MRKRWILLTLAAGLLALAVTGGVAMAQNLGGGPSHGGVMGFGGDDDGDRQAALAAKVAATLGTDEQATADALAQAAEEMETGASADFRQSLETRLQEAVDAGRITQERADEILASLDSGQGRGFGRGLHRLWGIGAQEYADRVGALLGVDRDAVADALAQAKRELRQESLESWRQRLTQARELQRQDFADRLAAVLGLDSRTVADAVEQVQQAMRTETLETSLQAAIESGRITQEQADEIRQQFESDDWSGFGGRGGFYWKWGRGHHGGPESRSETFALPNAAPAASGNDDLVTY